MINYKRGRAIVSALLATSALTTVVPVMAQESETEVMQETEQNFDVITVTATRRGMSTQDVPYNISAVSGRDMAKLGITDIDGLSDFVPGLNFIDFGARGNLISSTINLRGINTEGTANFSSPLASVAPVSTYVDETPVFANLRLVDIERVEVLRGPQGTLYGSGSLGGTVRFIQNKPKLDVFEGSISGGLGNTKGAGGVNYSIDGVVNIPVGEKLALRASVGYERDAGFIDFPNLYVLDANRNPVLTDSTNIIGSPAQRMSVENANVEETKSLRIAAYFEPSESVNILATYHHQTDEADALSATTPEFYSDNRNSNAAFGLSPFESEVNML